MNFSFEIKGDEELKQKLRKMPPSAAEAAGSSLYMSAEEIMTDSKENYVPILTGALRASGFVQPPEINGPAVSVTLSFGGPSVDYAVKVHEDMQAFHPHGQSKYLEIPLSLGLRNIEEQLAKDLDRAMEHL